MEKVFKNITRVVWILSLVSMFSDIASEMLYPIIPVYLQSIGFSIFLIGLLERLAEATSGLSKGYFGNWSDRVGRRMPFVRMDYFLSAIANPLMVVFKFPVWVFIARTIKKAYSDICKTKTQTGLKVIVRLNLKTYFIGIKTPKESVDFTRIQFHPRIPKLSYRIIA